MFSLLPSNLRFIFLEFLGLAFFHFEGALAPVPVRPRFGSEFPTLRFRPREQSGNNGSSLLYSPPRPSTNIILGAVRKKFQTRRISCERSLHLRGFALSFGFLTARYESTRGYSHGVDDDVKALASWLQSRDFS
jgi:hypothetical protein